MLVEHVPPIIAKNFPGAIIPGYDEGPVNQDAIVDGDHGSLQCGRLTSTGAVRLPVARQVTPAEWARATKEETGRATEMVELALQCWRRVPAVAPSRALVRLSFAAIAAGPTLAAGCVAAIKSTLKAPQSAMRS